MVNFSVFNELSLPLCEHSAEDEFRTLFALLEQLRNEGLNQIRMSDDFKDYHILRNVTFEKFIGQQKTDFQTRLKSFVNNQTIKINTPIINESEQEQQETMNSCEYFFNDKPNYDGLACADIWNTIAVSFDSNLQWNKDKIILTKQELSKNDNVTKCTIQIKHTSRINHLQSHKNFFDILQEENKQKITRKNLWNKKDKFFPNLIVFCPEVEQQIEKIDKQVFDCAMSILRDIDLKKKNITDFNWSTESQSVAQNTKLKKYRMFTVNGKQEFVENHIKSLPKRYRIYFLKKENKIYIGYIGKHLPLK
jgi:hypothetical protein